MHLKLWENNNCIWKNMLHMADWLIHIIFFLSHHFSHFNLMIIFCCQLLSLCYHGIVLSQLLGISFNTPRSVLGNNKYCPSPLHCQAIIQTCRPWISKSQTERERQRCQREGVFILRQQLKWVITALKFHSKWAPLTCHCESSHKEYGIFRESCTLTPLNWSGGSECCDRD